MRCGDAVDRRVDGLHVIEQGDDLVRAGIVAQAVERPQLLGERGIFRRQRFDVASQTRLRKLGKSASAAFSGCNASTRCWTMDCSVRSCRVARVVGIVEVAVLGRVHLVDDHIAADLAEGRGRIIAATHAAAARGPEDAAIEPPPPS